MCDTPLCSAEGCGANDCVCGEFCSSQGGLGCGVTVCHEECPGAENGNDCDCAGNEQCGEGLTCEAPYVCNCDGGNACPGGTVNNWCRTSCEHHGHYLPGWCTRYNPNTRDNCGCTWDCSHTGNCANPVCILGQFSCQKGDECVEDQGDGCLAANACRCQPQCSESPSLPYGCGGTGHTTEECACKGQDECICHGFPVCELCPSGGICP